jgi:predicted transcriptional regulator
VNPNLSSQDALRRAIRLHTEKLGMSQVELAKSARVSQPLISRFVAGRRNLSNISMDRLHRGLSRVVEDRIAAVNVVQNERAGSSNAEPR